MKADRRENYDKHKSSRRKKLVLPKSKTKRIEMLEHIFPVTWRSETELVYRTGDGRQVRFKNSSGEQALIDLATINGYDVEIEQ